MLRLEQVAQARYAGGLAMQQDVIRAQVEQTGMRSDLIMLESEGSMLRAHQHAGPPRQRPARRPRGAAPSTGPGETRLRTLEDRVRGRNRSFSRTTPRSIRRRNATWPTRALPRLHARRDARAMPELGQGMAVDGQFNIPLQQSSRRAMERESVMLPARASARTPRPTRCSELAENLSGIEAARRTDQLATTSLLPQAELTFNSALAAYENGKVDFATLLEAQQQIRKARLNQIKAQAEAQMRLAEIEKLLGEEL
jgi:outer membrane protein TolC